MTSESQDSPHPVRRNLLWAAALLLTASDARALGKTSLDLELDPYYTPLSLTVPFVAGADENDVEKPELNTYRDMLAHALVPRFMVLEASVNPMPLAGVLIRQNEPSFYDHAQTSPSANIVEALTAGFEEPWAFTAFFGKVIDYSEGRKVRGHRERGYVGYLASCGDYHILSNRLIPDHWIEVEAKIKGDQETKNRRLKWSYRFGAKLHDNSNILDTYYIGLRRDRTDFKSTRWSWLLSSAFEYRIDLDQHDLHAVGHTFLMEKNWPLTWHKAILSVGFGYLWNSRDKYSGNLETYRIPSSGQLIFRPNLKF